MKYFFVMLFFLVYSQAGIAERFSSRIHSFGFGKMTQPHVVRFDNSRVGFLQAGDLDLLNALIGSKDKKELVEVEVDEEYNLIAAQSVPPDPFDDDIEVVDGWSMEPYKPTIVKTYNSALKILEDMRKDYTSSGECYNRAHVWAYEEYEASKINSMKIFMFFTESYIRKYNFKWWFHVTPMVYMSDMSSPRTLDRRYTTGPRRTKDWSDIFIKSKRICEIVNTFNEFYLNQENEDCYHIYTSMYYVIPRDIEKRDLTGVEKTFFNKNEIVRAYRNAFEGSP